jgi:hypothetical protein
MFYILAVLNRSCGPLLRIIAEVILLFVYKMSYCNTHVLCAEHMKCTYIVVGAVRILKLRTYSTDFDIIWYWWITLKIVQILFLIRVTTLLEAQIKLNRFSEQ